MSVFGAPHPSVSVPDTDAPSALPVIHIPSEVFVEIARLLIVGATTMAGYNLTFTEKADSTPMTAVLGTVLGACLGYVIGGIVGRFLRRFMGVFERAVDRIPAHVLFMGVLGSIILGGFGALLGLPIAKMIPGGWGWPILGVLAWVGVYVGFQIGSRKAEELLELLSFHGGNGLRERSYASTFSKVDGDQDQRMQGMPLVLVDSSAAIDGRLIPLASSGFLPGVLAVPRFVLDELQGLADAADPNRRRRGRRALEAIQALHADPELSLIMLDDEVPERDEVDAKLVELARRSGALLLTIDMNLRKVAELQGVTCLDLGGLSTTLQAVLLPGDVDRVLLTKAGREPGQGVGYFEDGTMVIVSDGATMIGSEVEVTIASSIPTPKGRLFFATLTT